MSQVERRTIPASTAWKENPIENEQALFEGFAREITDLQNKVAAGKPPQRGFHAKQHVGLAAEFHVLGNLPEQACYGVFREPRIFPAVVRFSNGDSASHPDKNREPRGIAIKLFGVPGPKLLPGREDAVTQDFLATSHSVTSAVEDVTQFMAFVRAEKSGGLWPLKFIRALGIKALPILWALIWRVALSNVRSMLTEQYSSTAPIKLGPYAVKFTVQPSETTEHPSTENFLRDDLLERLEPELVLDFLVQFYVDDDRTPIENTSIKWRVTPLKVAELRIPKCKADRGTAKDLSDDVDKLSFTPWHAIEDHRPLGNVMRARRVAYEASSALRKHAPEPTGIPHAASPPSDVAAE
jgi:hypothetical protein